MNLTTSTSAQARQTAEWAAQRGITYLDGAIMAIPPVIGTADAVLLYSGPQSAFDLHESTLSSLGAGTIYLGVDHGLASLYDVALLAIMWSLLNGFLQCAALLGAAKVDAATFAPLANTLIKAATQYVSAYADQIDGGEYPALDAIIDTHLAGTEHPSTRANHLVSMPNYPGSSRPSPTGL
ncbi:MAG: hypothetical protein ACRDPW_08770 [Mycobacteriales bacterium]